MYTKEDLEKAFEAGMDFNDGLEMNVKQPDFKEGYDNYIKCDSGSYGYIADVVFLSAADPDTDECGFIRFYMSSDGVADLDTYTD